MCFFLLLLCYLLDNLPLTSYYIKKYRKLTWTVCEEFFFTIMLTICVHMCLNGIMCPYKHYTHVGLHLSGLLTYSASNDYNTLDHYWGTQWIILYLHTLCRTIIVHYLRIRCIGTTGASADDNIKPLRLPFISMQNQADSMLFQTLARSCGISHSLQTWVEMPPETLFSATGIEKVGEKKKSPLE